MRQLGLSFPAKITQSVEGYFVEFLDFDAFTEGDTLEEAVFNAQEALDVTLLGYVETDQIIPAPSESDAVNIHNIPASPEVAVPLLLYMSRKEEHRTISDVANAMGVSFQRYHDIEEGRNVTLKTLKRAAAALGATVEIKFNFSDAYSENHADA